MRATATATDVEKSTGAPVFAFVHVPRAAFTLLNGELVAEPLERLGQAMICRSCRGCVYFDMAIEICCPLASVGWMSLPASVRLSISA
jgi:hypothetical protein